LWFKPKITPDLDSFYALMLKRLDLEIITMHAEMDVSRGGWHDVAQQNVVLHVPQLSPFFYAINLKLLRARPSFMLL
jgi:hypothetical protein